MKGPRAHSWRTMRTGKNSTATLPWSYCSKCGCVRLRNEQSEKIARAPCEGDPDDQ